MRTHEHTHPHVVSWHTHTEDTIGIQLAVLDREVSLIQRWICTQLYVVGTADSVLIREASSIQSVLYREVPHINLCIWSSCITTLVCACVHASVW